MYSTSKFYILPTYIYGFCVSEKKRDFPLYTIKWLVFATEMGVFTALYERNFNPYPANVENMVRS